MTAVQRAKRSYYRRKKRRLLRRPRRILGRRRKPYARRRTTRKHVVRYARSYYRKRHLPSRKYYKKKKGDNTRSSQKARTSVRSARKKAYHRKPSRVGRPRKKKNYPPGRARVLKRKIKATVGRKSAKSAQTRKKSGRAAGEVLYNSANSATPSEDRQSKKLSGRNTATDSESHSQELVASADNQQNQQSTVTKKRGRGATQQNP